MPYLINRKNADLEKLNIELKAMRDAANSHKEEYEKLNWSKSTGLEKLPHNSLCETDTYEG